jgi:hypothetical protein
MNYACPSVPGDCDRCGGPTSSGVLCETCHVGGLPARPHPKRCTSCGGWQCPDQECRAVVTLAQIVRTAEGRAA